MIWLLWQICLAQWQARGLRGDLGADPVSSRRGLHIIGLDAGPYIVEC
jgi:hypothetical protein